MARRRQWEARSGGQLILAGLVLCLIVGTAFRLGFFGDSLYADEVGAFYDVSGHGLGRVLFLLSGHSPELNPPLYFLLAWIDERLFGTSVQALRLICLVTGVAVIPLTFLLGRLTVDDRAGLAGAALVSLSPFLVFYSSEARPYSLMLALTLVSTVALLKAIETDRVGYWALYAVASCAAMYTHFTAVFVLLVGFVWCLVTHPSAARRVALANLLAAIGFLPWVPNLIRTSNSIGTRLYGALEPLTPHAIRVDLAQLWVGDPQLPVAQFPGYGWALLAAVGVVGAGVAWRLAPASDRRSPRPGFALSRQHELGPRAGTALLVALAGAVPVATALYSAVRPSVWNSRDLIASMPAFATLVGAVLTRARRSVSWPAFILVAAALLVTDLRMRQLSYHRPDYRDVASVIDRTGARGSPVVNWPDVSPGPPSELEVALQLQGGASRHPVLRLGTAPVADILRAPPYTTVLPEPGQVVARHAAALAGNGRLFLVVPGPIPVPTLLRTRDQHVTSTAHSNILALLAAFMSALPPRFHLVSSQRFPGVHQPQLYTFQG